MNTNNNNTPGPDYLKTRRPCESLIRTVAGLESCGTFCPEDHDMWCGPCLDAWAAFQAEIDAGSRPAK